MKDSPPRLDDFPRLFGTPSSATAAPQTARLDPVLAVPRFPVEFDPARAGAARLDQDRAGPARPDQDRAGPARPDPTRATAEPELAPPSPRRTVLALGLILSLALHLTPLLVLLDWTSAPAAVTQPIPVQLVVEEPPPPPPPPTPTVKPPPPGRLASSDMGATKGEPDQSTVAKEPASDQPAETQIAALPPPKPIPPPKPPEPVPPPALVSALPKPVPPPEPAATMPEELKPPLFTPPAKQTAVARLPPNPHPARRAQVLGPAASRDEYLAHCENLIRSHLALSPAFLAGRSGTAFFELQVRDDGVITRIAVAQRSPHPDIDARIGQAVAAIRRFPPLPQWFQGPQVSFILRWSYPEGL